MNRLISGYAAVFDQPDKGGDIVCRGAFRRAKADGLRLLWQHDRAQVVGDIVHLEEDDFGLKVTALLNENAPEVLIGDGLSFGYRARRTRGGAIRELVDVDLIEISLVTNPMQVAARVREIDASMVSL